jgi:adenylate kinase family enzyme
MGIFDNEGAKVPLKKIMIIGSGGAGKSTLARQLGDLLSIEVIHLDAEFWQPHWTETPKSEWISRQKELIQKDSGLWTGILEERWMSGSRRQIQSFFWTYLYGFVYLEW